MQQTLDVAVVATDLARTDRRALSQAWYSALHIAEGGGGPAVRTRGIPAGDASRSPVVGERQAPRSARSASPGGSGSARPRGDTARAHGRAGASEVTELGGRRIAASPLARGVAREIGARAALRDGARRSAVMSFVVRDGGGRVQVLVRSDGESTRVVAVCSPRLRERVERALAHARFVLAAHGVPARVAS